VRKVYCVIISGEFVVELQSVVLFGWVSVNSASLIFELVLKVLDVLSRPMPTYIILFLLI